MNAGRCAEACLWTSAALLLAAGRGCARGAPSFAPLEREAGVLRVVTWNVGGASKGEPHSLRSADCAAVAAALAALAPDLVFLEEVVDDEPLAALLERLGAGWRVLHGRGDVVALARSGELGSWRVPLTRSAGVRMSVGGHTLAALGSGTTRHRLDEAPFDLDAHIFSPSLRQQRISGEQPHDRHATVLANRPSTISLKTPWRIRSDAASMSGANKRS